MTEDIKVVATNRKASFEYFLLEKFEAGLSLKGSEIKSIRAGQISIKEAFVDVKGGKQAFLLSAHIAPYEQANQFNHEPERPRKLLMHKHEIIKIGSKVHEKGLTLIPLKLYFKQGKVKEAQKHWELSIKEWKSGPVADRDPKEIAKLEKKLSEIGVKLSSQAQDKDK